MKSFPLSQYTQLRWKAFRRSPMLSTQLIGLILGGFLVLYFSAIAVGIGVLAGELIKDEFGENTNVFSVASDGLLYIFGIDLIMRVILQSSPRVDLRPLFLLPISKRDLLRKQNARPLFERLHLLWFLMFTTFTVINPGESKWMWWLGAMCLPVANAYIISLWKAWNTEKPLLAYLVILFALTPIAITLLGWAPMNEFYGDFQMAISQLYWPITIYAVILITLMISHSVMLRELSYKNPRGSSSSVGGSFSFLESYGQTGYMINLRLKQIWRNKRLKRIMFVAPLFLFYGFLIFGRNEAVAGAFPVSVACIFLTGIGAIQLGQWAFPMDGREFSFWVTNGSMDAYIRNKAVFLRMWVVLFTFFSSFYGLMGWDILFNILSAGLFNYGISIPFLLLISSYIKTSLATNEGGAFNMQGADTVTFLTIIPVMAVPWIITSLPYGWWIMLGVGALGALIQEPILRAVIHIVKGRKHIMLNNYSKKD